MPQKIILENMSRPSADAAMLSSAALAGAAWLAEVEPYITALAGLVAIVAGVVAAWYHIERARLTRAQRKKIEDDG